MRNLSDHDASSRRRQPYRATHRNSTSLSLPTPTMDSFDDRIEHSRKKHKRAHSTSFPDDDADDMAFFSPPANHFLQPSAPARKKSQRFLQDEIDEFLSEDLEHSFASNVSLNSPPHNPVALTSDFDPMDISPAPAVRTLNARQQQLHPHGTQRPRAYTTSSRLFGSDISNNNGTLMPSPTLVGHPIAAKPAPTQSSSKKTQRSALPTEWFVQTQRAAAAPNGPEPPSPAHIREPSSPMDDAMDVDTSYTADIPPVVEVSFSPPSAAPTVGNFNQLFYDTALPSPRHSFESPAPPDNKKRRSLSPESMRRGGCGSAQQHHDHHLESSPMLPSSPSEAKLERMGKPGLQGLGAPSASFLRRPRRPVLSAMVQGTAGSAHALSAYPDLPSASAHGKNGALNDGSPRGAIPVRRAFSAFLPPSVYTDPEPEDDAESSFDDGGVDMSSPAQAYSRRQQGKTIRRCDGTEDFRPLTGVVGASPKTALVINQDSPSAKFMAAGLPGFGDNEAHGKILPCHRVTEDGLMRISSHTLDDLLDGKFDDKITDFHVIDCRFDYEYVGGHVPGAVNINTTQAVEELLLGPSLTKPRPSVSGDNTRKTVLVFHCEFSAKRAPTFAKHLRAKDRAMNNHLYPKIHYPEVYILEGGYCQYFKTSAARCQPPAYVTMDDPNHATSRREDLDQFRKAKFGRHKSYAYGDSAKSLLAFGQAAAGASSSSSSMALGPQQQQVQPKRNTVPSAGPQSLFAAATAARSRRGGANTNSCLVTLPEDGNVTADADDTDTDVGDSPCPPPVKATAFKAKKGGVRTGIVRAETYGPTRMAYCS